MSTLSPTSLFNRRVCGSENFELLLEAITIVAAATITNYTGSVTYPPLEAAPRSA
jgi:hypothetical protein